MTGEPVFRHDASKDFDRTVAQLVRDYLSNVDEAAGMLRHLIDVGSRPQTDNESPITQAARILRPHLEAVLSKLGDAS